MTTTLKSKKDNGHWDFPVQLDIDKFFGFVYLIINQEANMMYIGKKFVKGTGKKNRGVESNWKTYTSSSKAINDDIKLNGKDHYKFIILDGYTSRGGVGWAETWSQCYVEVPSNNHIWYNRFIDKVSWRSSEHITKRHKNRLNKILKDYRCII